MAATQRSTPLSTARAVPGYSSIMRSVFLVSLAATLAAACGDDGGSSAPIDAPSPVAKVTCAGATVAATVTTVGFAFDPRDTTISAGQIVKFTMPADHSAISDTGLFRADLGAEACFRFDAAGTYPFHCEPHLFPGSIVVQ